MLIGIIYLIFFIKMLCFNILFGIHTNYSKQLFISPQTCVKCFFPVFVVDPICFVSFCILIFKKSTNLHELTLTVGNKGIF